MSPHQTDGGSDKEFEGDENEERGNWEQQDGLPPLVSWVCRGSGKRLEIPLSGL